MDQKCHLKQRLSDLNYFDHIMCRNNSLEKVLGRKKNCGRMEKNHEDYCTLIKSENYKKT